MDERNSSHNPFRNISSLSIGNRFSKCHGPMKMMARSFGVKLCPGPTLLIAAFCVADLMAHPVALPGERDFEISIECLPEVVAKFNELRLTREDIERRIRHHERLLHTGANAVLDRDDYSFQLSMYRGAVYDALLEPLILRDAHERNIRPTDAETSARIAEKSGNDEARQIERQLMIRRWFLDAIDTGGLYAGHDNPSREATMTVRSAQSDDPMGAKSAEKIDQFQLDDIEESLAILLGTLIKKYDVWIYIPEEADCARSPSMSGQQ